MNSLVRPHTRNDDDPERLRAQVVELEAALRERSGDVETLKADLGAFEVDYRRRVGTLHEQLEALELQIAEAELGELSKRLGDDATGSGRPAAAARPARAPAPRLTSDAVRKLFRDVAKAIHPDLAGDEAARDRRHTLMIEANRAYASGDEEQLRIILQSWRAAPMPSSAAIPRRRG